ncbi:MAG: ABC transporter substrate-binding protein [Pseudobutyrivibrio sp.]|nr:ABC transporter substrate-binding protein [Pseudobutyrivibrio sp.]
MYSLKRWLGLILAALLVLSFVSCGSNGRVDEGTDDGTDLIVVGFSQPGAESAWRVALTDSVKEAFTESKGYKLIYKDGQSKQDNQIRDIRKFIQQGVDYIILCPIVETGWDTVLSEAKQAGIPVIICDRNVVVSNESLYTAFVGSDFKAQGEKAVSYLEELYGPDEEGNTPEVNIVHIQGTIGSSAQIGRSQALDKALEEHSNWHIIARDCGEFTKAKSREIMQQFLQEIDSNDIDVIYCENDEEAFGAMAALNEAGINYGGGNKIRIISFDATENALEFCMSGQIDLVVECNPLQGPYLYNIVEMLNNEKTVPKITYVDENYFTPDKLSKEIIQNRKY